MFKALLMSVGMFSVIPVPKRSWDERYLPWLLPLMPVVGALIGGLWYAIARLVGDLPPLIRVAAVLPAPFILSGCLHLDGYMDSADAVFSRRDLEEKKRILKDPHIGAFAAIALAILFLVQFCAVQTVLESGKTLAALPFLPVVSRCVVGMTLLRMKPMPESGFASMLLGNTGRMQFLSVAAIGAAIVAALFLLGNESLAACLAVEAAAALGVMFYLRYEFLGISGDSCGCAITLGETAGLLALALI